MMEGDSFEDGWPVVGGATVTSGHVNGGDHEASPDPRELFEICDKEGKGFISKRDLQRLQGELPLSAEQLESVFDSLDTEGNGYLTLAEFTRGLGMFTKDERVEDGGGSALEPEPGGEDEEEHRFLAMMEEMGASSDFQDQSDVRELWRRMRRERPELLPNLEQFVGRVTTRLHDAQLERSSMEQALRKKTTEHERAVQSLYEEMELQIRAEQDKLRQSLVEASGRHPARSPELEKELTEKERELESLAQRQAELERRVAELGNTQSATEQQNERLRETNEQLEHELEHRRSELEAAQENVRRLRGQMLAQLQHERELEERKLSETMLKERESLVRQLDVLREINQRLTDEKDARESLAQNSAAPRPKVVLERSGSVMADYLPEAGADTRKRQLVSAGLPGSPLEALAGEFALHAARSESGSGSESGGSRRGPSSPCGGGGGGTSSPARRSPGHDRWRNRVVSIEDDPDLDRDESGSPASPWWRGGPDLSDVREDEEEQQEEPKRVEVPAAAAAAEVKEGSEVEEERRRKEVTRQNSANRSTDLSPERLFKVVLVGNSGVGKSCFIRRFCDNEFNSDTTSTIGVDYDVKTLSVEGAKVALQFWDTGGQERFRSITKQYFRKADGVVVVYDVTTEGSFTAVRGWMNSVKEGAGDAVVLLLLGNKQDLAEAKGDMRRVAVADGERLAQEYGMIFYECSAKSGRSVAEAVTHMARLLAEQEDIQRQSFHLEKAPEKKKKGCCD
ncbi:EF-hand calcium-binding domain-containing protein 4B-like isoform X2 [Petromyzon marinus]|uniref:EF-hand calcium-binding domain-containing protein 4B-like isoform X2 n=1 Tax=Petromyzon marinus TaxID=7757 RepID=UPI003F70489D